MTNQKSLAVLISAERVIAQCYTTAKNGDLVSYGFKKTDDGKLLEIGKAKVSRAKKYLSDHDLMYRLDMQDDAFVNKGFGDCC